MKIESKKTAFDYVLMVLFCGMIVMTVYPFLNVLAISLNDPMDTMRNVNFVIPRQFTLANYRFIFAENNMVQPMIMSVVKTLVGTGLGVVFTAMLAYVLSRKDFYFNKSFTIIFIVTMYVSGGMIPEYLLIMRTLRMGNNFWVYIIPGLIWVYNVILVRSFIEGMPLALQEAAKIDGANNFQIFRYITMPYMLFVTGPNLVTQFTANVNNFNVIYLLTDAVFRTRDQALANSNAREVDLLVHWLYRLTSDSYNYKMAGVIAIFIFLICAVATLIAFNRMIKGDREEDFQ